MYSAVIDLGGGSLGSAGNNFFWGNDKGDMRLSGSSVHALGNYWNEETPSVFNSEDQLYESAPVVFD